MERGFKLKQLIDQYGRHIHKLRLSLLDACNFRCIYCMPQNPTFMPKKDLMSLKEIKRLSSILVDLGIDEIRVTGGEPTLRPEFLDIMNELSKLKLKKLSFTTNGLYLDNLLYRLKDICKSVNFSLDSLNKDGFKKMTGSDDFEQVLRSIFIAKDLGFKVKINSVLMRGINDNEIEDFVEFSGKYKIEVRFLELMRIGPARNKFENYFIGADEIIKRLKRKNNLTSIDMPVDSTSFNYKLDNSANIGIIASESKPFCGGCSRLRLSANGELRPCLMINSGYSILKKQAYEIEELVFKTMRLKPIGRIYEVSQPMNQIGG